MATARRRGSCHLDGPREVADIRTEFQWLAANPGISDTQIGAWGISLGGGAAWNSVVAGIPFKALETFETWSDLYRALYPQNLGKSGAIYNFAQSVPADRIAPELPPVRPPDDRQRKPSRRAATARDPLEPQCHVCRHAHRASSSRAGVTSLSTSIRQPTPTAGSQGPKRLYVGDFGHSPSSFPGPELVHVLDLSTRWYDRFLKGIPNGVDKELTGRRWRSRPWSGKTASFARLRRRHGGSRSLERTVDRFPLNAKIVRTRKRPTRAVETVRRAGDSTSPSTTPTEWPHLVAVVTSVTRRDRRPS